MTGSIRTIGLMIVVCTFLVAGQIAFKKAVSGLAQGLSWSTVLAVTTAPLLWASIACIGVATLVWGYVLSYETLSRVYPLVSISYVLMAIAGQMWLGEPLTLWKSAGIGFIVLGVVCLFR